MNGRNKNASIFKSSTIPSRLKQPQKVAQYLKKKHEKLLCYPLVYLSSLAFAVGFFNAKFGARYSN